MNTTDKSPAATAETLTDNLFEIGSLWARHGLGIGRSALEASAKTLAATAGVLQQLSENLSKKPEEKPVIVEQPGALRRPGDGAAPVRARCRPTFRAIAREAPRAPIERRSHDHDEERSPRRSVRREQLDFGVLRDRRPVGDRDHRAALTPAPQTPSDSGSSGEGSAVTSTQSWWAARVAPMCKRCLDASSVGYTVWFTSTKTT